MALVLLGALGGWKLMHRRREQADLQLAMDAQAFARAQHSA